MTDDADFWVGPEDAPDTYRIVRLLGSGGEGAVYQAVLPLSAAGARDVAIKVIDTVTPVAGLPDGNGHLLTSLSHPGLVRVTHVFDGPAMHRHGQSADGRSRFVVMDYVQGVNLQEWLVDNDTPASARLGLLRDVAAALDAMHAGTTTRIAVAHGDVKPSNILVRPQGGAMLVDLGLVRLTDTAGISGRTKPYAAPELREVGGYATPASDNYAFIVTVAQTITGTPPPTDDHGYLDLRTLQHVLTTNPLTRRRPALVNAIMVGLAAAPEHRPQRLLPWLEATLDTLSHVTGPGGDAVTEFGGPPPMGPPPVTVAAQPAAPPVGRRQQRRRRRLPLAIAAAVVVILAVAGGIAYVRNSSQELSGNGSPVPGPRTSAQSSSQNPVSSSDSSASSGSRSGSGNSSGSDSSPASNSGASTRGGSTALTFHVGTVTVNDGYGIDLESDPSDATWGISSSCNECISLRSGKLDPNFDTDGNGFASIQPDQATYRGCKDTTNYQKDGIALSDVRNNIVSAYVCGVTYDNKRPFLIHISLPTSDYTTVSLDITVWQS